MSNGRWNVSKAEFQGYVRAKLESLDKNWEQTNKNTKDVAIIKGWVAGIGIVAGAVGGFVGRFFK